MSEYIKIHFNCVNDIKVKVQGTKGMVALDVSNHNLIQMYTDEKVTVPDVLVQNHIFGNPKNFDFESIRSFVDRLLEDKPFYVTLEDAANTSQAFLAIMVSAETRMPVEVDLPYEKRTDIYTEGFRNLAEPAIEDEQQRPFSPILLGQMGAVL